MASDSILSAAELRISEEERAGLIKLRDHFLSDCAPDHHAGRFTFSGLTEEPRSRPVAFNMAMTVKTVETEAYNCGCAACIGGHLSLLMQGVDLVSGKVVSLTCFQAFLADEYVSDHDGTDKPLSDLFYPNDIGTVPWRYIAPRSAGFAIGNFLRTARPQWRLALRAAGQDDLADEAEASNA